MSETAKSGPSGLRVRDLWAWAGLCALTLTAYAAALGAGFVWDDNNHVTTGALASWRGLGRIWFELGATQQYYPALYSAAWAEHRLWGEAALGYHLANVLLHATAAWLFGLVLRRLAIPGAWFGALIFAVHPVCVESVAWISEQKNTLSTVFYLLAALSYLRFDESRDRAKTGWWLVATVLFTLALLTKTVTATLPGALLVVLWWKRGRLSWRSDVLPLVPWFGLGAASGLFSAWVERNYIGAQGAAFALNAAERGLVAGRAVWFYLGKLLWPANLVFIYPRWRITAVGIGPYLFPLGLLALLAALWLMRRRTRAPLAALLFFVGSLFPTLGFFNVYAFIFSYVADHWQYLASLGIIALVAAGWGRWAQTAAIPVSGPDRSRLEPLPFRPGAPQLAALALVAVLWFLTWRQCRYYRDGETLYRMIIERNPSSWMAHNNLGLILAHRPGRLTAALDQYEEALRLRPDYPEAHYNLGIVLTDLPGRSQEAIAQYEEALRLEPDYPEAHNNLGSALLKIPGRSSEAIAHYQEALRLEPDYPEAHYNLGNVLATMPGRLNDAIAQYEEALRLRPDFAEAHFHLGNVLAGTPGRLNDAIPQYEEALRLRPDFAEAHNNLGNALAQTPGRSQEAITQYEEALRLRPDYVEAHNNLGNALKKTPDRINEAIAQYEDALRLMPGNAAIHFNLATALLRVPGRTQEAAAQLEEALRLQPGMNSARQLLARLRAPKS